ncbi:MAG TPA: hypothetical protein VG757_09690 [Devosia sp.]|nr:hypothetical protein [Devosia sp.]
MRGLLLVAGAFVLAGASGAMAADCGAPTIDPSGNSGTAFPAAALFAGDTFSCNFVADDGVTQVLVPANTYGVFRTDARGFQLLAGGDSYDYTADVDGDVQTRTLSGPDDGTDFTYTNYFATGLVGSDTVFDGDFTFDLTNVSDLGSEVDFDSIDVAVGYTTLAEQEDSLDEIGLQQAGLITHLDAISGLLTSQNLALEAPDEFGVFGAVGSVTAGGNLRLNLAEGFSVLGGVSMVDFGAVGASASGVIGAGAIRYVQPDGSDMRFFGEGGAEAGVLSVSFMRTYDNGVSDYEAGGTGEAGLGAAYVRGGVLWAPDEDNQVVFSATLKQSVLGISSFVEDDPDGAPNFFQADLSGSNSTFTTVKAGADWTTKLAADVDLTSSLAVGSTMGSGASADIFGIGTVTGSPQSVLFAEYGLRLGWQPSPNARLDGFIQGSTGTGIGTHTQVGAGYHQSF